MGELLQALTCFGHLGQMPRRHPPQHKAGTLAGQETLLTPPQYADVVAAIDIPFQRFGRLPHRHVHHSCGSSGVTASGSSPNSRQIKPGSDFVDVLDGVDEALHHGLVERCHHVSDVELCQMLCHTANQCCTTRGVREELARGAFDRKRATIYTLTSAPELYSEMMLGCTSTRGSHTRRHAGV